MGGWQQVHQVVGKYAVLRAVCLVAHHDDIVVGIDRLCLRVVELLNEREDERRIAFQLRFQVLATTCNKLLGLHIAQQAAVLKSITDLLVQFIAVCQHQERG